MTPRASLPAPLRHVVRPAPGAATDAALETQLAREAGPRHLLAGARPA